MERTGPLRRQSRSTHTSAPAAPRRPDIQGLRAVAVLAVVAFHAGLPLPGGFVGVDIFFVISGFVITQMLQREWMRSGHISLGRFYARRFRRLVPALALMVTVTAGAALVLLPPLQIAQVTASTGVGAMLVMANAIIALSTDGYFEPAAESNPLLQTWSLSVEEQFYLAFPILLLVSWLIARRRRAVLARAPIAMAALVCIASFTVAVAGPLAAQGSPHAWVFGFFSPLTRAWEFGAGALLALALSRTARASYVGAAPAGWFGLALVLASLFLITSDARHPGALTVVPVIGAVLLIYSGASENHHPVSAALSRPRIVRVGDLSYSIYLWHWPFVVFAVQLGARSWWLLTVAALLSFAPAAASFRWLEDPVRRGRLFGGVSLPTLIAATLAPPILISSLLWIVVENSYWNDQVRRFQAAVEPRHAGFMAGCSGTIPLSQIGPQDCLWNDSAAGPPIIVLGDSNADHLSEAAISTAFAVDSPLRISTTESCPFIEGTFSRLDESMTWDDRCTRFVDETLGWLEEQPPSLVILSASDTYWLSDDYSFGYGSSEPTTDPRRKFDAFEQGLMRTVTRIAEAGHSTLLVQTIPHFADEYAWSPSLCTVMDVLQEDCRQVLPRQWATERQQAPRTVIKRVGEGTSSAVFDPQQMLCNRTQCATQTDNQILYRDGFHLSIEGSESLSAGLTRAVTRAMLSESRQP